MCSTKSKPRYNFYYNRYYVFIFFHFLFLLQQQGGTTIEASTRPKTVDSAAETDEPSTRPKHHDYEEVAVQTDDREPPIKRHRSARFPDSAEAFTAEEGENKENETAPIPMPHERNALPIVNWRRSIGLRPMQAAEKVDIPMGAMSGFETAGRLINLPVQLTLPQIMALAQRAATPPLPPIGLAGTVNNPIVVTSPVRQAPRQGGAQGAVAAPRQGGAQGAVAAPRQGGVRGAVAAPFPGGARGAVADQVVAFRNEVTLMVAVPGDQPLVQREPDTPMRFAIQHTTEDDFRRFATDHNIRLERVDVAAVIRQLDMRTRLLSGTSQVDNFLWAPLLKHVCTGLHVQVIALMTLALHLYGNTELAYLLIFCVSKLSLIRIRQIMKSIWEKTHHY